MTTTKVFCNKCGFFGEASGPHFTHTQQDGTECHYSGLVVKADPMTTQQAEREERERIVWNEAIEAARYAAASTNANFYGSGEEAYTTMLAAISQLKRGEHRKDGHD